MFKNQITYSLNNQESSQSFSLAPELLYYRAMNMTFSTETFKPINYPNV